MLEKQSRTVEWKMRELRNQSYEWQSQCLNPDLTLTPCMSSTSQLPPVTKRRNVEIECVHGRCLYLVFSCLTL